eukprot:scaffold67914_cov32-Prasinocladus_malaysianus.AAC.1
MFVVGAIEALIGMFLMLVSRLVPQNFAESGQIAGGAVHYQHVKAARRQIDWLTSASWQA